MATAAPAPSETTSKDDPSWERKIGDYVREEGTDPDILKAFQEFVDSGIPSVPEEYFKRYLLPLTYHEDGVEKDISVWRNVTGSMTNGVRVVDSKNELLFTTPGLFPEMPIFKDRDGNSLRWAALADDAIRRDAVHPALGQQRLVAIGSRYLPDITPEMAEAHRQEWAVIWKRYDVGGHSQSSDTTTAVEHPNNVQELEQEDEI